MWPFNRIRNQGADPAPSGGVTTVTGGTTDTVAEALLARANGTVVIPEDTGIVADCRAVWERAGAEMRVEGDLAPRLQPWMSWIMACLARDGNAYFRMTDSGNLLPSLLAEIQGGVDPRTWRYHLTDASPTQTRTVAVPARSVLHFRTNVQPSQPWRGRPLLARVTGEAVANLEASLARASRVPITRLIRAVDRVKDEQVKQFQKQFERAATSTASPMVMQADGVEDAGPPITDGILGLRSSLAGTVAQAYGLHPSFFDERANGATTREAWRQFINGTLEPLATVIADECVGKTGIETKINVSRLRIIDPMQQAKAYAQLIDAGWSEEDARRATGYVDE